MEEQKKEREELEESQEKKSVSGRSTFLLIFAGIYLLYTGYTLCKNVLDGKEGAGWGFFVVGVIFIVIAAVMIFYGIKGYNDRKMAEKEAAEASSDETKQSEKEEKAPSMEKAGESTEEIESSRKPMTIAERAKLASRIEDTEEESEKTE